MPDSIMAYDSAIHESLREEVQALRKKLVALETAEADNEKLRKELARLKVAAQEEKSQMEMDFMNQLTGVARENSLKLEELEGRLIESNKVNRALSEQLQAAPTPQMIDTRIRSIEADHQRELAQITEASKLELERTRQHLANLMASRDELTEQYEDAKADIEQKEQELESLRVKLTDGPDSVQIRLNDENATLRSKVRQLEDEIKKNAASYAKQTQTLERRLDAKDSEISEKASRLRRIENQRTNKPEISSERVNSLEKENSDLKASIHKLEMDKKQQDLSLMRLERANMEMTKKLQTVEKEQQLAAATHQKNQMQLDVKGTNERKSWGGATSSDPVKSKGSRNPTTLPQISSHENKTTQIIRQLEHNLKKEGQAKQIHTAGLKSKRRPDIDGESLGTIDSPEVSDGRVKLMREEIAQLKEKLIFEREISSGLLKEISELKAAVKTSASKIPPFSGRKAALDPIGSPNRRQSTDSENKTPRTPVRGLVQSFEKRISQNTQKRMVDTALFDSDNAEELKDALHRERQQVFELEDELTRQCEINCALLKEIAGLSNETETSRRKNASSYHSVSSGSDQRTQIESLSRELSQIKQELAASEASKVHLSGQFEKIADSDRREIDKLSSEIADLKSKLARAEFTRSNLSRRESVSTTERMEIERLKAEMAQMKANLASAENELKKLRSERAAAAVDLESQRQTIQDLEQRQEVASKREEEQTTRVAELEEEVTKLKATHDEHEARKVEIASLRSLVASLETNLADSGDVREELQKEKEATSRLNLVVKTLQADLCTAEETVQRLTGDLSKEKESNQEKTRLLMAKVDKLIADLEQMKEERDELEQKDKIHLNKFDIIRAEIDGKVEEFEKIHIADKEEISRLHIQVKSLEGELQSTLETVENLNKKLKEKEEVEETVEELQRQNQHSLDSQITKLQKELTQVQLAEAEAKSAENDAKKKIESLEDSIAGLQSKNKSLLAEKDCVEEKCRRDIGDKDSIIGRLEREKEQLVLSMKDMTQSRRTEIDELQTELMEMSTRAANQAREVQTLKVQLEESSYRRDEMERLRLRVRELSEQLVAHGSARVDDERTTELQLENSELRQRLRDTSLALKGAEEKMRDLVSDKGGSSKSMQVLRERNASLKFEVEKLTKKLRKLADRKQLPAGTGEDKPQATERYSYNDSTSDDLAETTTRIMI